MEHHGGERSFAESNVTDERIRTELQHHASGGFVMLASGEPTLNPGLPMYMAWARQFGYSTIGLTTNARRLGYESYCRLLLDSGLNHVVVSVHGPDARMHDAQTRSPGSFEQTVRGLEVLARLRGEYRFSLHTSTVVGRRNVDALDGIYGLLRTFEPDQYVFNAMQPLGRAEQTKKLLLARYSDVVHSFVRLIEHVPAPRPRMYLVDVPACLTHGLPSEARGWVEGAIFTAFQTSGEPTLRRTRVHKEQENRVKQDSCEHCRYGHDCLGVWRGYLDVFGWSEFEPIVG
jgi:cyclic pyranopterin phosphate synthase